MIDPASVALFIPAGLRGFKQNLFDRIGKKLGRVIRNDIHALAQLPDSVIPIVGCTPELRGLINDWQRRRRTWIYWDRGYFRRVFATDLPTGQDGGFYRWHVNSFQLQEIRLNVPSDRWIAARIELRPWQKIGDHIVVAEPSPTYQRFHGIDGWTKATVNKLKAHSKRRIVVRDKEQQRFGRKLHQDLKGAHALVTHGSNAAVEAAIMGCPVFVDRSSAAIHVGLSQLDLIEQPIYPDRASWLNALAYSQFDERELVDGTLWRLIS